MLVDLDPSRQVQAHVTHSCVQCVAPSTKEIIQQTGKGVTNIGSSHILHGAAKQTFSQVEADSQPPAQVIHSRKWMWTCASSEDCSI